MKFVVQKDLWQHFWMLDGRRIRMEARGPVKDYVSVLLLHTNYFKISS